MQYPLEGAAQLLNYATTRGIMNGRLQLKALEAEILKS
jgi:hypothetical protein